MVGRALDRIVRHLYGTPAEKWPANQMGAQIHKALNEELLIRPESTKIKIYKDKGRRAGKEE